VPGFEVVQVII